MKTNKKNTKKQIDFEQEDEFELSQQNDQEPQNKIKDKKSIKNVYQELLSKKKAVEENAQLAEKIQSKKDKKKQKQKLKKEQVKQEVTVKKEKKQAVKEKEKYSSSMKFINNKVLEDELRKTTLQGVTKIFNLIVSHRKEMEN